jgi:hypothetical protein
VKFRGTAQTFAGPLLDFGVSQSFVGYYPKKKELICNFNPALPEVVGFPWEVPSSAADHSCILAIAESADDPINPYVRAVIAARTAACTASRFTLSTSSSSQSVLVVQPRLIAGVFLLK